MSLVKKRSCIIALTLLIVVSIFFSFSLVNAQDPYSKITEIECKNTKVQIKSDCLTGTDLPYNSIIFPYCVSQQVSYTDIKTGQVIQIKASGDLAKDAFGVKRLDALAGSVACVSGSKDTYLIINYYTGGNCSCCEWDEILNLQGNRLASSSCGKHDSKNIKYDEWNRIKQLNSQKFDQIYKSLGLPPIWPKTSFIDINLHPNKESKKHKLYKK